MIPTTFPSRIEAFSGAEYLSLLLRLQNHHAVFYWLWNWGRPYFNDRIPTACMIFDPYDGTHIDFEVNPEFWKTLSATQREFIICHEILHVLLNHGIRGVPLDNKELANIAMDLVVNQTLIDHFGFNIDDIDPERKYCWLDVFFKPGSISKTENFEYYYKILNNSVTQNLIILTGGAKSISDLGDLVDDHSNFIGRDFSETLKDVGNRLTKEEFEDIRKPLQQQSTKDTDPGGKTAGTSPGNLVKLIEKIRRVIKPKWETVVKKWSHPFLLDEYKVQEQWIHTNRRLTALSPGLFIPTEAETNERFIDKRRIRVWFFLDTSGSCAHLADRFFKAAESLPEWRFDVILHCFDTRVYKTDFKSRKLYGFGGTSFSCIEDFIQREIKQTGEEYPKAVWLITDGMGDSVRPEKPDRWYWFLSANYRSYIPKESPTYMLSDFE